MDKIKLYPIQLLATKEWNHYSDVVMTTMASQITSLTIVYSTIYSCADQRKHQSSAYCPLWGEFTGNRWIPPREGPVTRKMFPFDDVIMSHFSMAASTSIKSILLTSLFLILKMFATRFPLYSKYFPEITNGVHTCIFVCFGTNRFHSYPSWLFYLRWFNHVTTLCQWGNAKEYE